MSKIVISTFVTLDGVMEDPGGSEGFQHGGWQLPFFDQDLGTGVLEELFAADALLLGRVTYQHFAAAWPSLTDEEGFADRMNSLPKFVASTTLQEPLAWNAILLKGDVAEAVAELKRQPGQSILVQGSSELAQTLMRHSLIDEYRLWVHPVVVGSGKRPFHDGIPPTTLRLVGTQVTSTGVVRLTYQPAQQAEGSAPTSSSHHGCLGRPPPRAPQFVPHRREKRGPILVRPRSYGRLARRALQRRRVAHIDLPGYGPWVSSIAGRMFWLSRNRFVGS